MGTCLRPLDYPSWSVFQCRQVLVGERKREDYLVKPQSELSNSSAPNVTTHTGRPERQAWPTTHRNARTTALQLSPPGRVDDPSESPMTPSRPILPGGSNSAGVGNRGAGQQGCTSAAVSLYLRHSAAVQWVEQEPMPPQGGLGKTYAETFGKTREVAPSPTSEELSSEMFHQLAFGMLNAAFARGEKMKTGDQAGPTEHGAAP
ncbi:hypothetical protein M427DRAFT_44182 [Gonapodya prolifera JEL478]|uniref:Uncharacterized protein n=1 Tax=Gonapodya prolifera (strain JEL478) TaxID=1344416 RepID=A0A139AH82_GONPJ|nr:hypothetical protein M427DRAFT_44182 [Gonapodya prolifera JEL478]|eukprot:KXS16059.1 hypothetical protein M427DRAFT_44182 [Gonapodya prolifera JEL478]